LSEKVAATAYIGASRVIFTFGCGHPFDLVKTRMQADPKIKSGILLSKEIYRQTGIRGFYAGGIPNFSRTLLKEAYRNPQRAMTKSYLKQICPDFKGKEDAINIATGLTMACTDSFLICPLERLKVWMMTNYSSKKHFSQFFTHQSGLQTVSELFRGLKPSFVRSCMSWVSYLVAEEKIWQKVKQLSPRVNQKDGDLPLAEQLLVGSLGGIVNSLCTLPFDAVKTHMQKKEHIETKKITTVLNELYANHGLPGLYAGWKVRLPHYAIVGVLTSHYMRECDKIFAGHKWR